MLILNKLNLNKLTSTTYHPETNGQIKRTDNTIKQMIRCLVDRNHQNWDEHLNQFTFAYNTSVNETTRKSPFKIVFGCVEISPFDLQNQRNIIVISGDLFDCPIDRIIGICVGRDFEMNEGIAKVFKEKFNNFENFKRLMTSQAKTVYIKYNKRFLFYLVIKQKHTERATIDALRLCLIELKEQLENLSLAEIAIPRLACGQEKLIWHKVKNLIWDILK